MGERGFLVTFVQVDPLFTLDLSDPENPFVAGELKVPGYSTYLHPINSDYLLAIGQDISVDGGIVRIKGLQLSVFDTSNFTTPTLIHSETIGDAGTYSEALYNHKAVAFWPGKNLLALPVSLNEINNSDNWGANTFNGLYVYRLSDTYDFEFQGRIPVFERDGQDMFSYKYYPAWYRGLFIEDYVYALTPYVVKAAPINNIIEPFITLDLDLME